MTIHRTTCNRKNGKKPPSLKFSIVSVSRRQACGAWVKGNVLSFTFEALIFPEHAAYPDYEIEQSQISKLCIRRRSDRAITYAWDRGLDIPAADADTQRAIIIVCTKLASAVYGRKA